MAQPVINNGVINSTAQYKWGSGSLYFNNNGCYINNIEDYCTYNADGQGFYLYTISFWWRPGNLTDKQTLFSHRADYNSNNEIALTFENNSGTKILRLQVSKDGTNISDNFTADASTLTTGNWYFITCEKNDYYQSIWINGTRTYNTAGNFNADMYRSTEPFRIGYGIGDLASYPLKDSYIDNFRITAGIRRQPSDNNSGYSSDFTIDQYDIVALRGELSNGLTIIKNSCLADLTLVSFTPTDNSITQSLLTNLVMNFDATPTSSTGNIVIYNSADDSIFQTIAANSGNVTINGTQVTVTHNNFVTGNSYYILIDAAAFNNYVGITDKTYWNFAVDTFLDTLSPLNGAIDVPLDSDLTITFLNNMQKGTGNIIIKRYSDDSSVEIIPVNSSKITVVNKVVTINPSTTLGDTTEYYVTIASGALKDLSNNNYPGFSNKDVWKFTTTHTIGPVILSTDPANASTSVYRNSNLILNWDENVIAVPNKYVYIKKYSDDTLIEQIEANNSKITVNGSQIIINPTADLAYETQYYVTIDAGAYKDTHNNGNLVISSKDTWKFTTIAETVKLPVLDPYKEAFTGSNYNLDIFTPYKAGTISISGVRHITVTSSDSIALSDNQIRSNRKINPDSISLTDSTSVRILGGIVKSEDTITLTDSQVRRIRHINSDSISLTDTSKATIAPHIAPISSDILSLYDRQKVTTILAPFVVEGTDSYVLDTCKVDLNRTLVIYKTSTKSYAVMLTNDIIGKFTKGTPIEIDTNYLINQCASTLMDSNRVLINFDGKARIIKITNNNELSIPVNSILNWRTYDSYGPKDMDLQKFDTNKALLVYNAVSNLGLYGTIFTIDDNDYVYNHTEKYIDSSYQQSITPVANNKVALYYQTDLSNYLVRLLLTMNSDNTITRHNAILGSGSADRAVHTCIMNGNKGLVAWTFRGIIGQAPNTSYGYINTWEWNGSDNNSIVQNGALTTINYGTTDIVHYELLEQLTTDKALLVYRNQTGNNVYGMIITTSGTTITTHTPKLLCSTGNTLTIQGNTLKSDQGVIAWRDSADNKVKTLSFWVNDANEIVLTRSNTTTLSEDIITLTDSQVRTIKIISSDSFTITDTQTRIKKNINANSISLTDTQKRSERKINPDSITLSDNTFKRLVVRNYDSISLNDNQLRVDRKINSDEITLTDAQLRATRKINPDSISLTDEQLIRRHRKEINPDSYILVDLQKRISAKVNPDSVTTSDNQLRATKKINPDIISITDLQTRAIVKIISDSLTLIDSQIRHLNKLQSDSISVSDNQIRHLNKLEQDTLTLVDSQIRHLNKLNSELALSLTDNQLRRLNKLEQDILTLVDSQIRHISKINNESSLSLSDNQLRSTRKISDDSITLLSAEKTFRLVRIFDSISLIDEQLRKLDKIQKDDINITDNQFRHLNKLQSESINNTDEQFRYLNKLQADLLSLTDSQKIIRHRKEIVSDMFNNSDMTIRHQNKLELDNINVNDNIHRLINRLTSDTLDASDNVLRYINKLNQNTIEQFDSIIRLINKFNADELTLTDYTKKTRYSRSIDELSIEDLITRKLNKTEQDNIINLDNQLRHLSKLQSDSINTSDEQRRKLKKLNTEILNLIDNIKKIVRIYNSDELTLTDSQIVGRLIISKDTLEFTDKTIRNAIKLHNQEVSEVNLSDEAKRHNIIKISKDSINLSDAQHVYLFQNYDGQVFCKLELVAYDCKLELINNNCKVELISGVG